MNKAERSAEARRKLIKKYKELINNVISRDEFIDAHRVIMEYAEKYDLPRSRGVRQDNRDIITFYDRIRDTAWREFFSIGEWLFNEFRFQGHRVQVFPTDEFGIGWPDIVADDKPDYEVKVQKNRQGEWNSWLIDSKVFKMEEEDGVTSKEIIFLKDNNIRSYCKYNSDVFVTTHSKCIYLPSDVIERFNNEFTPCERPHPTKKGHLLYENSKGEGKKGVEISDREGAHLTMLDLFNNYNCEVWRKNSKRIVWTKPLRKFNRG